MNSLDVNDKAKFMSDNLVDCVSVFIKNVPLRNYQNMWYTAELWKQRIIKDELYKKVTLSDEPQDWTLFESISTNYSKNIHEAKNLFYHKKLFDARNDQAKTWKVLKQIVNGTQSENPSDIDFHGEIISDKDLIADSFNKFFINSVKDIRGSIPDEVDDFNFEFGDQSLESFKFKLININDIKTSLRNINSDYDTEFLSKKVMLDAMDVVGNQMVDAINSSLKAGWFPNSWKNSTISPIQKVTATVKCEEFRPINMLPMYEKVLEDIAKQQLEEHLEKINAMSRENG